MRFLLVMGLLSRDYCQRCPKLLATSLLHTMYPQLIDGCPSNVSFMSPCGPMWVRSCCFGLC
jgi:hypothetical protein